MHRAFRAALALAPVAYFWNCVGTYRDWHFIDNANLVFHEAGHTIFSFFGELIQVAAGSAFQVALPLGIAAYFFRSGRTASGSICLMWAGQSLLNVSVYAADASEMALPLLGGDSTAHDWNYLLGRFGLLDRVADVSNSLYGAGVALIAIGSALTLYYSTRERRLAEAAGRFVS